MLVKKVGVAKLKATRNKNTKGPPNRPLVILQIKTIQQIYLKFSIKKI